VAVREVPSYKTSRLAWRYMYPLFRNAVQREMHLHVCDERISGHGRETKVV